MRIFRYEIVQEITDVPVPPGGKAATKPVNKGMLIVEDDCEQEGSFLPDVIVLKAIRERDPNATLPAGRNLSESKILFSRRYERVAEQPMVVAECTVIRLSKADIAKFGGPTPDTDDHPSDGSAQRAA